MNTGQFFVRVRQGDFHLGYDVFIVRHGSLVTEDGKNVPLEEVGQTPNPTVRISAEEAQSLVEQLSACGVKPQRGYLEGKLEATERHLEDIREVAKLGRK